MKNNINTIPNIRHTDSKKFLLIAGPCAIEDRNTTFQIAQELKNITDELQIPFIFKASYAKMNRTRYDSFQSIGVYNCLRIFREIKDILHIPITTDIHSGRLESAIIDCVDVIQIPALLCRQTDIIEQAAKSGKWINIKKAQWMSLHDFYHVLEKANHFGAKNKILWTERGSFFGYQDIIADFKNIYFGKVFERPVIVDITHPMKSAYDEETDPQLIERFAKAAIAMGADGIFMETHPDRLTAKSDGKAMYPLSMVKQLLTDLIKVQNACI